MDQEEHQLLLDAEQLQRDIVAVETEAERLLLARQEMVECDKSRNSIRESLTALRKQACTTHSSIPALGSVTAEDGCTTCGSYDGSSHTWIMFDGADAFFRLPFHQVHSLLERDQITLDRSMKALEGRVKEKALSLSDKGAVADKVEPGLLKSLYEASYRKNLFYMQGCLLPARDKCEMNLTGLKNRHNSGSSWRDLTRQTAPIKLRIAMSGEFSDLACMETKEQQHVASFQLDSSLVRHVVGARGITRAKIEKNSGAVLHMPSKSGASKFNSVITVTGPTEVAVNKAVNEIEELVENVVKSPSYQYTHFISLPLALHGSLVKELESFEEAVLSSINEQDSDLSEAKDSEEEGCTIGSIEKKNDLGIDKSIFVKPKTIHLTVLMLKLWNEDRIKAAAEILQKSSEYVKLALDNKPLEIDLNGVELMKGNPAKAHVLYARVEEADQGNRLWTTCHVIIDAFIQAGLVLEKDQKRALKLHATLMNTSHRRRRQDFDARHIISCHGSRNWGRESFYLSSRLAGAIILFGEVDPDWMDILDA